MFMLLHGRAHARVASCVRVMTRAVLCYVLVETALDRGSACMRRAVRCVCVCVCPWRAACAPLAGWTLAWMNVCYGACAIFLGVTQLYMTVSVSLPTLIAGCKTRVD
jgi:hypothetical protein